MQNADFLMASALVVPAAAGLVCLLVRTPTGQKTIVIPLSLFLVAVTVALLQGGIFSYSPPPIGALSWEQLLVVGDAALLASFFYFGWRARNRLILALAAVQTAVVAYLEVQLAQAHPGGDPVFVIDHLAIVMAVVIGVVGPSIAFYALHYMDEHEHHLRLPATRQPRFFAVLLVFLGAMNGLVFANSLPWLFFFWEVTTLCSYLLIGHDGTNEAKRNAERALSINLLGGIAFAFGMVLLWSEANTLSIQRLVADSTYGSSSLFALGLLVFAGCTKAAQMPFQSWLLGAMVAPTPVSALLHSSTMVKAGVYLVVRLAPGFEGTWLSQAVALVGGFTFLAAAVLAVSQSNAKRVLAYSTISNLGLIIACAGINTPLAVSAAILLILFHAFSKGVLFLAVGAIEQKIGSRDIEAMEGLLGRMPLTTIVTLVGIFTMLLPPFGVLIAKWAAIEAAARAPLVLLAIAAGTAFTVLFWTKWMGRLVSRSPSAAALPGESMPLYYSVPLLGLSVASIALTALVFWIMEVMVEPAVATSYQGKGLEAAGGQLGSPIGSFPVLPLMLVLAVVLLLAYLASRGRPARVQAAYLCGENAGGGTGGAFLTAVDQSQTLGLGSYYFEEWLSERRLTRGVNVIAGALLIVLLGVAFHV